jgi:dihydroflavonol-4-reductase
LGVTLVTGDINDREAILKGMKGCKWLIHIAAAYSFWEPKKKIYRDINVEGTRTILECALAANVSKVVHVSTVAVFGNSMDNPITEDSEAGTARFSEYAQTKYEGDEIAWDLYEREGLPLVMIYPGAVLGAGDPKSSGKYIQDLIHGRMPVRAFEDVIFPWVYVGDVAEVIARALEKNNNIGEKYLVAGRNLTHGEINKMISQISRVPLPKIRLPGSLAMINAMFLTWLANLTKRPPLWGMAEDLIWTMKESVRVDGSKVERDLGITYTPIRVALEEAISSIRK